MQVPNHSSQVVKMYLKQNLKTLQPVLFLKNGGRLNFEKDLVAERVGRQISTIKMAEDKTKLMQQLHEFNDGNKKVFLIECSKPKDQMHIVKRLSDSGHHVLALVESQLPLDAKISLFRSGAKRLIEPFEAEKEIAVAISLYDRREEIIANLDVWQPLVG